MVALTECCLAPTCAFLKPIYSLVYVNPIERKIKTDCFFWLANRYTSGASYDPSEGHDKIENFVLYFGINQWF